MFVRIENRLLNLALVKKITFTGDPLKGDIAKNAVLDFIDGNTETLVDEQAAAVAAAVRPGGPGPGYFPQWP